MSVIVIVIVIVIVFSIIMANFIDNESYLKEKAKSLEDQLKDSINEIQRLNKDIERLRRLTTSFGDCYILKHLIGHGAFGNVYEAIRIIDNYRVAVKVVERKALDPKVIMIPMNIS